MNLEARLRADIERIRRDAEPGRRPSPSAFADDLEALLRRLSELEQAVKRADKIASKSHDAMWAMDFETTSAGRFERETWTRPRKRASDEIHKLHEVLRASLSEVGGQDEA